MPAKPLTPEQKQDAARLKSAYEAYKAQLAKQGQPNSQDAIAEKLNMGQSAMSQYLNGRIPLNGEALLAFCSLFGALPMDISPSIFKKEHDWSLKWISPSKGQAKAAEDSAEKVGGELLEILPVDILEAMESADEETRGAVAKTLRMMLGLAGPSLGKAGSQQGDALPATSHG